MDVLEWRGERRLILKLWGLHDSRLEVFWMIWRRVSSAVVCCTQHALDFTYNKRPPLKIQLYHDRQADLHRVTEIMSAALDNLPSAL